MITSPAPSQDQLQRWVSGAETPPADRRNLTYERGIAYLKRQLQHAISQVPEYAVAEIDRVVWGDNGAPVMDPDGLPKVERVRVSQRSVEARPWLERIKRAEAEYRAFLTRTSEERQDDNDALQKALEREFGPSNDRAGLHREVEAFAQDFLAKRRAAKAA
ncbi:MAG TPA: hypothetical protein VFS67_33745 [Polyangiaceae bacterium]|nr:hypothetical protein [Polyangiaceae bacterium]